MGGRSLPQQLQPGRRQLARDPLPSFGQARRTTQPVSDQAVNPAGQAAAGDEQAVSQIGHAQRPARRLGEVHQDVVVVEGQTV